MSGAAPIRRQATAPGLGLDIEVVEIGFFLDARMENFLRGHVGAFTAWNGCPRVLLYDNLKSAVLDVRDNFFPARLGRPQRRRQINA